MASMAGHEGAGGAVLAEPKAYDGHPLTALWVTAFGLANIYSIAFLLVAYFNARPAVMRHLKAFVRRARRRWIGGAGAAGRGGHHRAPAAPPGAAALAVDAPRLAASAAGGGEARSPMLGDAEVRNLDSWLPGGSGSGEAPAKPPRDLEAATAAAADSPAASDSESSSNSDSGGGDGDGEGGEGEDEAEAAAGGLVNKARGDALTDASSITPSAPRVPRPDPLVGMEWHALTMSVVGVGGNRDVLQVRRPLGRSSAPPPLLYTASQRRLASLGCLGQAKCATRRRPACMDAWIPPCSRRDPSSCCCPYQLA
jgi:hypothetical protein